MHWKEMQTEHAAWMGHNFPGRDHLETYLGMVEECMELITSTDRAGMLDGIGDVMIFACGFCTDRGIDFSKLVRCVEDDPMNIDEASARAMLTALGRVAQSELKMGASIRGEVERYADQMRSGLVNLFRVMDAIARFEGTTLAAVTFSTWASVRERDWQQHPETGVA